VGRRKIRVEKAIERGKAKKMLAGPPAALSRNLHHFLSFKHVAIQRWIKVDSASYSANRAHFRSGNGGILDQKPCSEDRRVKWYQFSCNIAVFLSRI
jgi:hypothetical protein